MTKELEDDIEEIKAQLAEAEKAEDEVVEEPEAEAETVEEPAKEETEEKEAEVEEKPEAKPEKEVDDVGAARLRREAAAYKKRAEEAEARLTAKPAETEIPERQAEDPLLRSVKERELVTQAMGEFTGYVDDFRARAPMDFQGVADAYEMALMQSIKIQNPRLSQAQLVERTQRTILEKAGQYVKGGFNPAEEMYHEAKALGIKAYEKEPEGKPAPKPDLSKIAANKARNAGTAGAKGAGEKGQITPVVAADMPAHEWAKLPIAQRKQIMDDLKARGRAEAG